MMIQNALADAVAGNVLDDNVMAQIVIVVTFFGIFMLSAPIVASVLVSKCAKQYHKRESATQLYSYQPAR